MNLQTHQLPSHQQRVIIEKTLLDDNIAKLKAFIEKSPIFADLDAAEKERLTRQHTHMTNYSEVLGERINAF